MNKKYKLNNSLVIFLNSFQTLITNYLVEIEVDSRSNYIYLIISTLTTILK